ncbi:MAG: hypothetical protein A2268_08720 [Candidatus Raymondbacteria bacterium RifOxyA12_full_50_37]|uniref:STAS domain-containing protein n=1 Tax=Candidatus Raymondbacteria bacterium RIFOXYD12_FULL_49_13 TaxID=1817890 RepID=A0A1F7FLJ6_UNCRA|nr:MAG: hypothetical protein A2268_08720 [Candidatus Raymondbacteria bacterium RifOxyA12_full_50_37]OGJ93331.1 MAG: hypothetical protein A2248_07950 [Candidatus Raymondbacteria bacterium RIFOXYA2_FULL_49_16]OGJ95199.1 MAG: hypothetical protein A2453_12020 [Candidatus Raymondbacteria bacterium RIFOXYC2_FULL_50_21]OGK03808.1 MAG: hypothetical protein A2350_00740 [Candidatus Raymondbacteria bacterium RifOxyB12_full_50_8]OGK07513.1 MAG: hypothetical protein A2519_16780 [Candidatus Raymondbacteria b
MEEYSITRIDRDVSSENFTEFRNTLRTAIEKTNGHVVLDFTSVNLVYSFGISLMIKAMRMLNEKGRNLYVIINSPTLNDVFVVNNLNKLFHIFPDIEAFEFEFYRQHADGHSEAETELFESISLTINVQPVSRTQLVLELNGIMASERDYKLFRDTCDQNKDTYQKVLVDCKELSYVDSPGISALVDVNKLFRQAGGQLYLCSLSQFLLEILETAHVNEFIPIFQNRVEALNKW